MMEWIDIRNLRWQGKLLFQEVSLGATARPGEMAYHGQTFDPPMREFFREGPTLSERTTLRGPNIEPRNSPSPRPFPQPGYPSYGDRRILGHGAITEPHFIIPHETHASRPREVIGDSSLR